MSRYNVQRPPLQGTILVADNRMILDQIFSMEFINLEDAEAGMDGYKNLFL
jgi:hypothetical protein